MIAMCVRRGVVAGLVAGLFAGLLGLFVGEPSLDAAVDIEETANTAQQDADTEADDGTEITRPQQKAGLVVGSGLFGAAIGALFGIAAAWAVGRLAGDAWTRSLKLGAVLVSAVVVLPAAKYPPSPPGAGDPATVELRTTLYLGLALLGLLLATASWTSARTLRRTPMPRPVRQALVGAGTITVAALLLVGLPPAEGAGALPAELVWSFRLGSIAIQTALYGGTAVLFGLLAARWEQTTQEAGTR